MPLLWLSLAFLIGILLGSAVTTPALTWLGLASATLLLLPAVRVGRRFIQQTVWWQAHFNHQDPSNNAAAMRIRRWSGFLTPPLPLPPVLLLLCFLFLGAARYQSSIPPFNPGQIAWYNDQPTEMVVEGLLVEPPDERDQFTYLRVKIDQLHPANDPRFRPVEGLLLARVKPGGGWRYGDWVRLEGTLETPFSNETFSYQEYLAHQGIYSLMGDADGLTLLHGQGNPLLSALHAFRDAALQRIQAFFPDPEASLLAGILLGVRTGIPESVNEAFQATGTSHIIAISGFNITLLAGVFIFIFGRLFGRWRGAAVSALIISLYTLMVGASAAVVRAAILAVFSLFGRQLGRRQTGINSLAIIAAIMVLIHPGTLWDIGFQLSFAATLGLVLYADIFLGSFNTLAGKVLPADNVKRLAGPVGAYLLFTLAAQLTTVPLVWHYTGDLSLSALIANPLILPAQPAVMILGGIATLLGILSTTIGQWAAYLAWPFLAYTIRTVEWIAGFPGGVLHLGSLALPGLILFFVILFGWTLVHYLMVKEKEEMENKSDQDLNANESVLSRIWHGLQTRPWLPLVVLALLTLITWRQALSAPDGRLQVTILDVGSGEAIYIRTPGGRNLLVNGGSSGLALADELGRRLPPGGRRFDWWLVANGDEESVAALPFILERYPPGRVLWAGATHGTYAARQLWEDLTKAGIPVQSAETGQVLALDGGGTLEVLHAGPRGAVLLLRWEKFSLLLPVGASFEALDELEGKFQPVTALLLADSGYAPLNPPEWLERLHPQMVMLSVAADDRQGLPDAEVLEALQGYTLLRTDVNGWIELTTDGEQMWVEVERK